MVTCENFKDCPLYKEFKLQKLANMWVREYCKGNFLKCKRRQLKLSGKDIPLTLLPNGQNLIS